MKPWMVLPDIYHYSKKHFGSIQLNILHQEILLPFSPDVLSFPFVAPVPCLCWGGGGGDDTKQLVRKNLNVHFPLGITSSYTLIFP